MINNIKRNALLFLSDELIFYTAAIFMGTILMGGIDFLYHFISVRMLKPEDYGVFNTLLSLVMLSVMAINPLGITITRFFAEHLAKNSFCSVYAILLQIVNWLFIIAGIVFLLLLSVSFCIAKFLGIQPIYIILCAAMITLSLFSKTFLSFLQGIQKFKIYSVLMASSSFLKLILGGILMYLGWGVFGGLTGFLIQPAYIICLSLFLLPIIFPKEKMVTNKKIPTSISLSSIYKSFFPNFIAMLSFAILTNIDVILVRHFFSSIETGHYSIAQMIGKAVFFLASCVAIVTLPKGAEAFAQNTHSLKLLFKSLFLGGLICFFATVSIFLYPDIILKIVVGKSNPASTSLVGLFSLTMSFNALLWIIINFSLAIHNLKFVLPLLFLSIFQVFFIYNYHSSLTIVLYILLIFSMISFLVSLAIVNITNKQLL